MLHVTTFLLDWETVFVTKEMIFKNIFNSSYLIVFFLILVLYNIKIAAKNSPQKPIFTEIVKNISRVNNLLQDLIKSYVELEKLSRPKYEDSDYKTDTEIEELFDGELNNRADDTPVTESSKDIATPLFFSDISREINAEETAEKENHDSDSDEKSDSVLSDSDDTSSSDITSKSDNSTEEILIGRPREIEEAEHAKVLVIHLASSKRPDEKTNEQRFRSELDATVRKKIQKATTSKSKGLHNKRVQVKANIIIRGGSGEDDVCKKAVMKKCSKAVTAVLKDACSRGKKCSAEFKEDFRENSKIGCNQKFNGQSACRNREDLRKTGDRMTDLKKQFLRYTCLRTLTDINEPAVLDHPQSADADPKFKGINILRDRYEKACKRKSYNKCCEACNFAIIKTCKKHECTSVKEKFMDRSCKKRCRESYKFIEADSDDSDDSDSDDDSSDSD